MKKKVLALFVSGVVFLPLQARAVAPAGPAADISGGFYAETFIVTSTDHRADFSGSFMVRSFGNTSFSLVVDEDPEDLEAGDIVSAIMHRNGTEKIIDDVVIAWKYSGHIDQ